MAPSKKKLLVFAHVPPPHHGQAVMVELMLGGLRADPDFEIFHVDARVSDDLEDVGGFRPEKLLRLLKFCLQAIRLRFRHGPMDFYYVPAPAKKSAILRDWIVMLLVRPWFRRTIFHWHAFGLGHWATGATEYPAGRGENAEKLSTCQRALAGQPAASSPKGDMSGSEGGKTEKLKEKGPQSAKGRETEVERCSRTRERLDGEKSAHVEIRPPRLFGRAEGLARWLTRWLLGGADVSMVLTEYNRRDADFLRPKRTAVVPNGIPDPCPDFVEHVLPVRRKRAESGYPGPVRLLFLGHCMESKGLLTSVRILAEYRNQTGREACLTVAGKFPSGEERAKFDSLLAELGVADAVNYVGFADEHAKRELFLETDLLLFPTQYPNETFGLVVIEAMAFGVPALVSSWRGIPELLPPGSLPPCDTRLPSEAAKLLLAVPELDNFSVSREWFASNFSLEAFISSVREAVLADVRTE
jgi:glycosyltransferase involved in cell wall biosynthesis